MFDQFNAWATGKTENQPTRGDDYQRLREISLEYSQDVLLAATQNLDPFRKLGSGNYGCVYRGTLQDGSELAIKVMEVEEEDSSGFAEEVLVLSKFRHPNLVTLMGWGTGCDEYGRARRFLVYELLAGGDVAHRLQKCQAAGKPFTWVERLWVALDAACGLSHMHNSTPKAFHRDIKSANILLDRTGTAKMADFGLSGIAKNKNKLNMTCQQISGTPGYACPHYIKTGKVTEQTEVYAYGMVLMEILLNMMPACMGGNGVIIYPMHQKIQPESPGALERAAAAADQRAEWPPTLAKDIAEVSLTCTRYDEKTRPAFTDVGKRLRELCQQHCGGVRSGLGCAQAATGTTSQMGTPGAATNSTRGAGCAVPSAGVSPPTRPELGMAGAGGYSNTSRGSAPVVAPASIGPSVSAIDSGMASVQGVQGMDFSELVLECTYSSGIDVASIPSQNKSLVLCVAEQPWAVGRQQQPNFFSQLVPDEATRALISRSHVTFNLDPQSRQVSMRKLSANNVQVNGKNVEKDEEVRILNGAQLHFFGRDPMSPILSFTIRLQKKPSNPGPYPHVHASTGQHNAAPGIPSTAVQERPLAKPGMSAAVPKPNAAAQPPSWWSSAPSGSFSLLCVSVISCDLSTTPREARTVPLKLDGSVKLGRSHQSGLFEHLLRGERAQKYLCCVSRSHVEISAVAGKPTGSFEVVNLSANPVAIAGPPLGKGESAILTPGICIDFIGTDAGASNQTVTYLKLRLEAHSADAPRGVPGEDMRSRSGHATLPAELPPQTKASDNLLPNIEEVTGRQAPTGTYFRLVLQGSAVQQSFPSGQRTLEGSKDGILVGRFHQQILHNEAFSKEVREYLSRDHFRIDRDKDGYFSLVALSSNSIWRSRNGQRRELERGDPAVSLIHDDEILLFTGASDGTPDGRDCAGTLTWKFVDAAHA
eukprot:TRINITY_DN46481_c0_g1_i1.p1 TRINITY_DN46481_c0_g1~~TRINITY_DN46481_c0_g1_i1.p1  ORF type:complete len:931 (+),score=138.25 TRINITY_DN46481_c0_g1_i1:56-2848(+)